MIFMAARPTLPHPPRDYFADRITHSLLGPGSDTFAGPAATEVLDDYPLQRYYTGILFPERQHPEPMGRGAADPAGEQQELFERKDDEQQPVDHDPTDTGLARPAPNAPEPETERDEYAAANHYFPTNAGLTLCVVPGTATVQVTVRGACYQLAPLGAARVRLSNDDWSLLQSYAPQGLVAKLTYDEATGHLFFAQKPSGRSSAPRSGDFVALSRLLQLDELKNSTTGAALEKLMAPENRMWQRVPFEETYALSLTAPRPHTFVLPNGEQATCHARVLPGSTYGKYVKLLLQNKAQQPANRFSNASEILNEKCLFQMEVAVLAGPALLPYRDPNRQFGGDPEAEQLNYQYRDCHAYGLGHGCAVQWDMPSGRVATTFLPQVDVPGVSNGLHPQLDDADKPALTQILSLRALSIWGEEDVPTAQLLAGLKLFAAQYSAFIGRQQRDAEQVPTDAPCYEPILRAQRAAETRLLAGIALLETTPAVMQAFRLANTAMLLQMVLSNDPAYGKSEKEHASFDTDYATVDYQQLEAFRHHPGRLDAEAPGGYRPFAYRPFQLAFLLLSLDSVTTAKTSDRELVDLIWFPTGGGKTEAYLAVAALTIVWRRLHQGPTSGGVAVLMRYTLRLLTAQQFERATRLICALEFLRGQLPRTNAQQPILGTERISIGMWVGQATTPNDLAEAKEVHTAITKEIARLNESKDGNPQDKNRFQLAACPWCGCRTVSKVKEYATAFAKTGQAHCLNRRCAFGRDTDGLPVSVVDEVLYKNPPTLLFATVDKFAMLPHKEDGYRFFKANADSRPPDLIIQDELHLLNGPLGSITGLFERIVNLLCTMPATATQPARPPKIIASTATTRNTAQQVRGLYQREVAIFPPAGIRYDDSYFAFNNTQSKRRHIGLMATGKTGLDTQLQLTALLLFARSELLRDLRRSIPAGSDQQALALKELDHYWTLVVYYNSLRDVGKMYNKVGAEVFTQLRLLHQRFNLATPAYDWSYRGLTGRTRELTSRVESGKIKDALNELSHSLTLRHDEKGRAHVGQGIDLVLASNMLSVGIDISRLNLMLISGQPRNSAEYIQASSRVARENPGTVFVQLDANRAREKSVFEQFTSYNESYYKYVEPLSLTPFTQVTFDRMLNSLLVTYVRHYQRLAAHQFRGDIAGLKQLLDEQITDVDLRHYLAESMQHLADDWVRKIAHAADGQRLGYAKSARNPALIGQGDDWDLMMSMREIDTTTAIAVEPILD
jgi:hypothetical protein